MEGNMMAPVTVSCQSAGGSTPPSLSETITQIPDDIQRCIQVIDCLRMFVLTTFF